MTKTAVHSQNAPAAIGPYSQAVKTSPSQTIYLSGQIPLDPETMAIVSDSFSEQAHQTFSNLRAVAVAAGGTLDDCVKLNIYLTDLSEFQTLNDIMSAYFAAPYPARAAFEVSRLPKNALIEIDGVMALQ